MQGLQSRHVLRVMELVARGPSISTSMIASHPKIGIILVEIIIALDLLYTWRQNLRFQVLLRKVVVPMVDKIQVRLLRICIRGIHVIESILFQSGHLARLHIVGHVMSAVSWGILFGSVLLSHIESDGVSMFRTLGPQYNQLEILPKVLEMVLSLAEVDNAYHLILHTKLWSIWVASLVVSLDTIKEISPGINQSSRQSLYVLLPKLGLSRYVLIMGRLAIGLESVPSVRPLCIQVSHLGLWHLGS